MAADGEESSSNAQIRVKDPRLIARKYQLDLCKKAVEQNIIVYLKTGCGKTHIAVLLMYELAHLIKKPQKDVCVFLAPTVPLVRQEQATSVIKLPKKPDTKLGLGFLPKTHTLIFESNKFIAMNTLQASVIEESTDFIVGSYYGDSNRTKNHQEWEKEIEKYEVLVMTPQILLHNLFHRLIKMELIALLIFDECHHAQAQSSHPYAEIMKVVISLSLSLSLSLVYKTNATKRPRIFGMTASPIVGKGRANPEILSKCINSLEFLLDAKVYSVEDTGELERYVASPNVKCYYYGPVGDHSFKKFDLEEIKNRCIAMAGGTTNGDKILRNRKKLLLRLHDNLMFCLENLGLLGAKHAVRFLMSGDRSELIEMIDIEDDSTDNSLTDLYLSQAASVLDSESIRGYHSGVKSMSRKTMNSILEKFRSGELNLLVATRVGEEGLDIQTCCLVIRFDLPETVASFIQSKGRARMSESEYVFLVNRENEGELNLIEDFISEECQMMKEIACRTSGETFDDLEEVTYTVCSTGASITAGYSVSLLYHYCSKLPHDEFFIPTPEFDFEYDTKGTLCRVILPSNAPIHQVDCPPQSSKEKAKKIGCLRACKELHAVGALTDYLLPGQDDEPDERSMELESFEDESSRGELHQMLSPSVLKNTWTDSENPVLLNFYFIECLPVPNDRLYQKFGLFVKAPLPEEAGTMELDLHLAHGRIVKTKLVPQGVKGFERDEIIQAQNIQELFLKIVLDRSEFFANFVKLGKNASSQASHSAFYLLLPVRQNDCEGRLTVDWKLIRRCLSSPVFGTQKDVLDSVNVPDGSSLILADGPASKSVIVNSLVFTPHKKLFFFVDDILPGIDANSPFTDRSCSNYVDHYAQK
ncbi:hypothetical protein IFM89_018556 [Coptis chinensis]|uniref:Dicer-like protein 4 n=1 Tax=Coptis chinensis TaxID=261450 RepID=A0A835M8C1_9MAGN|nr:hypothetical protein IFM89_018556 [Coptis chinensis]